MHVVLSFMEQIKLGLPKGSLNTPGRGDTKQVLIDAGYDVLGYEPGQESDKELAIVNDPEIVAFLTRPQSAPVELNLEMLDAAIIGDDWVREETANGKGLEFGIRKIGDLEYGQTRLVVAISKEKNWYGTLSDFFRLQSPILCFTEYVNITREWFVKNEGYQKRFGSSRPLVKVRGLVEGENDLVRIIHSDGVTEGYIAKGADIIVDNTQSGSKLREYNLKELEEIMKSSAGLYAGPGCTGWKEEKAGEVFDLLKSAVVGKKYFDVKFNAPNGQIEGVNKYLIDNNLCADEPTITRGTNKSAVNVLIPRENYISAVKALREEYGASAFVRNEVKQFVK